MLVLLNLRWSKKSCLVQIFLCPRRQLCKRGWSLRNFLSFYRMIIAKLMRSSFFTKANFTFLNFNSLNALLNRSWLKFRLSTRFLPYFINLLFFITVFLFAFLFQSSIIGHLTYLRLLLYSWFFNRWLWQRRFRNMRFRLLVSLRTYINTLDHRLW